MKSLELTKILCQITPAVVGKISFVVTLWSLTGCGVHNLQLDIPVTESVITGTPEGPSHKTHIPVTFGGDAVSGKYKVGVSGATDCNDSSGYSVSQASGVPVTLDLNSLPDGEVVLCYMGFNSAGAPIVPQKKVWIKDTSVIQYVELSQTEARLEEADAILNYTITLSSAKNYNVKINWERVDGDGIYGVHHMLAGKGSVTIPAGQTSAQVQIPILNNTASDGEKYFGLRLTGTNSTRVHVGPDYQILIYEKDNDGGQASRILKLFSNRSDTCALFADGSVKCRGFNEGMIQGTPTIGQYHELHVITGLNSGVIDLSSGGTHFCAVMSDQTVRCWGLGTNGQLGNNLTASSSVIVTPAISGVTQISLMEKTSCALKSDGTIWCWGKNNYGQVGDNTIIQKNVPVQVQNLPGPASSLITGFNHGCALVSGVAHCWGHGGYGALGNGAAANKRIATAVPGLSGIDSLHGGTYSTCALKAGAAICWGTRWGDLGAGNETEMSPVSIPGLGSGVSDIGFSENFACAIKNGSLYCLEGTSSANYKIAANGYGYDLAIGFKEWTYAGNQNLKLHISVSGWNTGCIEDIDHNFKCFEGGWYGTGWFMNQRDSFTPLEFKVLAHENIEKMDMGFTNGCALDKENSLWCWGVGVFPTSGVYRSSANAILLKEFEGRVQDFSLSGYDDVMCMVVDNGEVYCWRYLNPLNPTDYIASPEKIPGITNAQKVVSLGMAACALLSDKTVKCWGFNSEGSLGDGTGVDSLTPVSVQGLSSVETLLGYGATSCALTTPGAVYCWGSNYWGQIGNGDMGNNALAPVQVVGLSSGVAEIIRTSRSAFCGRLNTGEIKCWGGAESLGDGSGVNSDVPVTAILPLPAVKLYPGPCARLSDQSLYCWGNNYFAQNTMNSEIINNDILTPIPFSWAGHEIAETIDIQTGRCLKTNVGKYYCWGYNNFSVLGDMKADANKALISNKWFEQ